MMGGKRNVMSGGSHLGGGDLVFPAGHIYADFLWEVKTSKLFPEKVRKALDQAELEARSSTKMPAAVMRADNMPRPVVYMYLDDWVNWTTALAEMGQGQKLRSIIRQMRYQLDELEQAL